MHGPHAVSGVDRDRLARSDTDADATGAAYSDHTDASCRACVDPRGYFANEGTNPQPDSGRLTWPHAAREAPTGVSGRH